MNNLLNISHEEKIIEFVDVVESPNEGFEMMKQCFLECAQKALTFDESWDKINDRLDNVLKERNRKGYKDNIILEKSYQTSYYNDINSIYVKYKYDNIICKFNQYGRPKKQEDESDGKED